MPVLKGLWGACPSIRYTFHREDEDIFAFIYPISACQFRGYSTEFFNLAFYREIIFLLGSLYFNNYNFNVLFCNHIVHYFSINFIFQWIIYL